MMKRALARFSVSLLIACLVGSGIGSGQASGEGRASDTIWYQGREVAADRVLVKMARGRERQKRKVGEWDRAVIQAAGRDFAELEEFEWLEGVAVMRYQPKRGTREKRGGHVGDVGRAEVLQERIARLRASGLFAVVEPDPVVRVGVVPTDGAFSDGRLWGLRNTGQEGGKAGVDINVVPAWAAASGGQPVTVAVLDTGIRLTHVDLASALWRNPGEIPGNGVDDDRNGWVDDVHGINFINENGAPEDDHGHGTHCAAILGAVANGGGPLVGVAWNVRLMAVKFLSAEGSGYLSDALRGLDYAIQNGARVVNASWGGYFQSEIFDAALRRAGEAGLLIVAAAGNGARDLGQVRFSPAGSNAPNVVAVAAVDRRGELAWFSNYSPSVVHLGAPGVQILSATAASDTSLATWNGTSMAAPYVTGAAALIAGRYPSATVQELKQRLLLATTPLASLQGKTLTGGMLNVAAALDVREDGQLELLCRPAQLPLPAGGTVPVFVSVSDLFPVRGAVVRMRVGGGGWVELADNGVTPDALAGDGIYTGTVAVPLVSGQMKLEVQASAEGKRPASGEFVFAVVSRPPNDGFAHRTPTGGGITRSRGTNRNATREAGEPLNPQGAGGKTVWWSWVAPETGEVTISTAGSTFDTTLAVYTGNSLRNLELVAANDDSGGLTSAVTFLAEQGREYAIQVDGFLGEEGEVVLNHPRSAGSSSGPPVILEEPPDRNVPAGYPFSLSVRVHNAERYQWYFNGQALAGETGAVLERVAALETHSGEYVLEAANAAGAVRTRGIRVFVERTRLRPANDDFANAEAFVSLPVRVAADTYLATSEPREPNHGGIEGGVASVWYRWVATGQGFGTVSVERRGGTIAVAVYEGTSLSSLQEVGAQRSASGSAAVSFSTSPGATYWIAVATPPQQRGDFVLSANFQTGVAPSKRHDHFSNRMKFEGNMMESSNVGATGEEGEPNHAGTSLPLASVWWEWTAPADGSATFTTLGSNFDTTLAVYQGARLEELRVVAAMDDLFGRLSGVTFRARKGEVFVIAVDGKGEAQGMIRLNLRFHPDEPEAVPGRTFSVRGQGQQGVMLRVDATGDWTVQRSGEWLRPSVTAGRGRGVVRVDVEPNRSTQPRSGWVIVAGVKHEFYQEGLTVGQLTAGSYSGIVGRFGFLEPSSPTRSISQSLGMVFAGLQASVSSRGAVTLAVHVPEGALRGRAMLQRDGRLDAHLAGPRGMAATLAGEILWEGASLMRGSLQLGSQQLSFLAGKQLSSAEGSPFRGVAQPLRLTLKPWPSHQAEPIPSPQPETEILAREAKHGVLRAVGRTLDGSPFTASWPAWNRTGNPAEIMLLPFWRQKAGRFSAGWICWPRGLSAPADPGEIWWQLGSQPSVLPERWLLEAN